MRHLLLVCLLACSGKSEKKPALSDEAVKAVAQLEKMTAEACGCMDQACLDRVSEADEANRSGIDKAIAESNIETDNGDLARKALDLYSKLNECLANATGRIGAEKKQREEH